jgi:hypothetical protein
MPRSDGERLKMKLKQLSMRDDDIGALSQAALILNDAVIDHLRRIKTLEHALKKAGIPLPPSDSH